ncbi:MAG: hypothetical protein ACTSW1_10495 [Candidatus Hodarchaeales archaeon]
MKFSLIITNVITSFISSILIFFVIDIFSLVFPVNILSGIEIIVFLLIFILSMIVFLILPPESSSNIDNPQSVTTD